MSPVANMLAQIRNGQNANKKSVLVPFSNFKLEISRVLQKNGFIGGIEKKLKTGKKSEFPMMEILLVYKEDGRGRILGTKMMSKPSRRMYLDSQSIKPIKSGTGMAVLSTSKGVMNGDEARKASIGGEIIFEIW